MMTVTWDTSDEPQEMYVIRWGRERGYGQYAEVVGLSGVRWHGSRSSATKVLKFEAKRLLRLWSKSTECRMVRVTRKSDKRNVVSPTVKDLKADNERLEDALREEAMEVERLKLEIANGPHGNLVKALKDEIKQLNWSLRDRVEELRVYKASAHNPNEYVAWLEYRNKLLGDVYRMFSDLLRTDFHACQVCMEQYGHADDCKAEWARSEYCRTLSFKP